MGCFDSSLFCGFMLIFCKCFWLLSDINFPFCGTLPFFTFWNDKENVRHKSRGYHWTDYFTCSKFYSVFCRWGIKCKWSDSWYQLFLRLSSFDIRNECGYAYTTCANSFFGWTKNKESSRTLNTNYFTH